MFRKPGRGARYPKYRCRSYILRVRTDPFPSSDSVPSFRWPRIFREGDEGGHFSVPRGEAERILFTLQYPGEHMMWEEVGDADLGVGGGRVVPELPVERLARQGAVPIHALPNLVSGVEKFRQIPEGHATVLEELLDSPFANTMGLNGDT